MRTCDDRLFDPHGLIRLFVGNRGLVYRIDDFHSLSYPAKSGEFVVEIRGRSDKNKEISGRRVWLIAACHRKDASAREGCWFGSSGMLRRARARVLRGGRLAAVEISALYYEIRHDAAEGVGVKRPYRRQIQKVSDRLGSAFRVELDLDRSGLVFESNALDAIVFTSALSRVPSLPYGRPLVRLFRRGPATVCAEPIAPARRHRAKAAQTAINRVFFIMAVI